MCYPSQPIKAWELELEYPTDKLEIVTIAAGTIFDGLPVFFVNGTVNETAGKIEKLYSVILGAYNVSDDGSLVSITFKSKKAGIANLNLINVGICNETKYLPIDVVSGTVYIDASVPLIFSASAQHSKPIDTEIGWTNISANVTDDTLISSSLLFLTTPSNSLTLPFTSYYYNSSTTFNQVGNYSYYIRVNDTVGNYNESKIYNFTIPPNYEIVVDGVINLADYIQLATQYGKNGPNGWIREDVDNNGNVYLPDFVLSAMRYQETWW
jgi:hypothetical protein